jgi:uncharacterized membrane protein
MARPLTADQRRGLLTLDTREIVVSGVLGAIAIFLGVTGLGFIPVPNVAGSATVLHIPAILGGVLEGPVVGVLVGAIFGVFSWLHATVPIFKDPLVAVLPRLVIGLVAAGVFSSLRRWNVSVAAAAAGALGSAANTVGVLVMAVLRGWLVWAAIPPIIPQSVAEAVIAAIITVAVVKGVDVYRSGRTSAPEIETGQERRY